MIAPLLIICVTIIVIILITKSNSCQHDWELLESKSKRGWMGLNEYLIVTQKCKKCGLIRIKKYIND